MEPLLFPTVISTQATARELFEKGQTLPFAVVAETQSGGRGRSGKQWMSPAGGLWFTLARTVPPVCSFRQVAIVAAYSLARVICRTTGLQPAIKWPNDILIRNRKVSGILAEALIMENRTVLFLGIGLNINNTPSPEHLPRATSLAQELGRTLDLPDLRVAVLAAVAHDLDVFGADGFEQFLPWIQENLALLGKEVTVTFNTQRLCGRVRGIAKTGALLLEQQDTSLIEVDAGSIYNW